MKGQRFFAVACASAILLVSASAFGQLTDDERKCSDAFNKAARNVANQEQKNNRKACIKDNSGDVTTCVNNTGAKAVDKQGKLNELFLAGGKCETPPATLVNNGGTPAGSDAGDAAANGTDDILRDIWGDPVDGVTLDSKCADSIAKRTGKIYDTILKAFRKCTKDAGTLDTTSATACVGTAVNDAKVTTFAGKLSQDVENKCDTIPEPGTEDGDCGSETVAGPYAACASSVAKCNGCLAIEELTGVDADCDLLDNGASDASCGVVALPSTCGNSILEQAPLFTPSEDCDAPTLTCPTGSTCNVGTCQCEGDAHKCTFDGAVDNSQLQICFLGVCPAPIDISGAVDLTCNPADEAGNGKRPCTADLQTFDPFVLSGVGTICIDPGVAPCPDGELDCDGGNSLSQEVLADADIGACTSNADCDGQCGTYCSGLGMAVYNGACENFCQGGSRADLACICDLATGATCSGGVAGVNDCPGGSCEGKDNEPDTDCHCTCIDASVAPASAAGAAQYRLGIAIRVEADPICDNTQVLVRLPEQCAPFTTATSTVTQLDANETGPTQGPWMETGVAGNCAAFDASTTTAFEFVSTLAFMDSTIGDLQSLLHVDCQ